MASFKEKILKSSIYLPYYRIKHPDKYAYDMKVLKAILELSRKLRDKKCHFLYMLPPKAEHIVGLSEFETDRLTNWTFDFNNIQEKDAEIIKSLYEGKTTKYLVDVYSGAKVIEMNGHKCLVDYESDLVNIRNGIRITKGQPINWINRIHLYGACTLRGTGVEDSHTISSFLQSRFNEAYPDTYQCINHGIGCASTVMDDIYQVENTILYEGDTVVICNLLPEVVFNILSKKHSDIFSDSSCCFNRPHSYGEWFTDATPHTNEVGNKVIAGYIFDTLKEKAWINTDRVQKTIVGCLNFDAERVADITLNDDFKEYADYLLKYKKDTTNNGAIVMNCNPFTLGHRYLIEYAASKVDNLFIFVVEEDKSYFKFVDRYKLVEAGTSDIANVTVVKSGKFIISAVTFPGYFYKDNDKSAIVDTSADIDIFGKFIAPILSIKTRFAGEEPLDGVTNQYNDTMRERLPLYGMEFHEIPRKNMGDNVISASRVRKCIKDQNWAEIEKLVPKTTYDYLIANYKE